ncbi:PREDICTED: uncharacterized protein LOC106809100 [Priapulus caudatus]|uniref:Uncharacterized protein LOC106809100 n=1 Tax=Priapulus caudatus TaxID=37621 RepID=A0ABM1E5S3_PRICU|nr:PREDICTED: uncharacterized protein LOC106809100 [Priapulus caudatus]
MELHHVYYPNEGPVGARYYGKTMLGCLEITKQATQLCLDAIDAVPFSGRGSCFRIADFGAADGGNSMALVKLLIGVIPKPESYLIAHPDVRVFASGTSFYKQCFSNNSIQFGFCMSGMFVLSRLYLSMSALPFISRPCNITDGLHSTEITVAEEREMFKRQAAEDWENILVHRARELQPGARLVIANYAADADNQSMGRTKRIKHNMFKHMTDKCRTLMDEGIITKKEFQNMNVKTYFRTEKELEKPLINADSPVYKLGLRLESIEIKLVNCYFYDRWLASGIDGNAAAARAHAQSYVRSIHIWGRNVLLQGLSDIRTPHEKAKIVDAFFQSYEDDVAKHPRDHGKDYVIAYLHIKKLE